MQRREMNSRCIGGKSTARAPLRSVRRHIRTTAHSKHRSPRHTTRATPIIAKSANTTPFRSKTDDLPKDLWKHERGLDQSSEYTVEENIDEKLENGGADVKRGSISPQSYYQISRSKISLSRWYPDVNSTKDSSWWDYQSFRPEYNSSLDDYGVISKLGHGKFSEVYEGVHHPTSDRVVIKLLRPIKKDKIRREVLILNHVKDCPFVTHLREQVRHNESRTVAFVYSWQDNVSYSSLYPTLTLHDIKRYAYQLLVALAATHANGIMHRDIKPGNILIDPTTKIAKIGDWGLAEFYHPHMEYHTRVGTKGYKAPELLLGLSEYDYSVDMFALGVTLGSMMLRSRIIEPSKDDAKGVRAIAKFTGSAALMDYIEKYRLANISKSHFEAIGSYPPAKLTNFVNRNNAATATEEGLDLLTKLLTVDHYHRIPAHLALQHPFFDSIRHDPLLQEQLGDFTGHLVRPQ